MPTGYTAELSNGEQSFEDFVLNCARAMGACIMQKEEDLKQKPKLQEPPSYYKERISEIEMEIKNLENMPLDEYKIEKENERQDRINHFQKQIKEKRERAIRYDDMIGKVKKWNAPTNDHINFKHFMLSQLKDSKDWDCRGKYEEEALERHLKEIENIKDLYKEELDSLNNDLARAKDKYKEELERTNSRNQWIIDLYESLGLEI